MEQSCSLMVPRKRRERRGNLDASSRAHPGDLTSSIKPHLPVVLSTNGIRAWGHRSLWETPKIQTIAHQLCFPLRTHAVAPFRLRSQCLLHQLSVCLLPSFWKPGPASSFKHRKLLGPGFSLVVWCVSCTLGFEQKICNTLISPEHLDTSPYENSGRSSIVTSLTPFNIQGQKPPCSPPHCLGSGEAGVYSPRYFPGSDTHTP